MNHNNQKALDYNREICQDIADICKPLFEKTGITNFFYVRIYNDGSRLYLSHRGEWVEHYVENGYYEDKLHDYTYILGDQKQHCALWTGFDVDKVFQDVYEFNVWNGFTISHHYPDYCESFLFAADKDNHKINNYYINNIDALTNFIFYFKEKALELLNVPESKRIRLSIPVDNHIVEAGTVITQTRPDNIAQAKRYYLKDSNQYLSKREVMCVNHLLQGESAKKIAQTLKISPRTVEWHINNAKVKTNCRTKSQLIDLLKNTELKYLIF